MEEDGRLLLIDLNGEELMDVSECDFCHIFPSGTCLYLRTGDVYRIYDMDKQPLSDDEFVDIGGFDDGYAYASQYVDVNGKERLRYGYLSETGELAIPCILEYACSFNNGHAIVKRDGQLYILTEAE